MQDSYLFTCNFDKVSNNLMKQTEVAKSGLYEYYKNELKIIHI